MPLDSNNRPQKPGRNQPQIQEQAPPAPVAPTSGAEDERFDRLEAVVTSLAGSMHTLVSHLAAKESKQPKEEYSSSHAAPVKALLKKLLANRGAGERFFVVLTPETEETRLEVFDTPEPWLECMAANCGGRTQVFPFIGHYTPISAGPHRYVKMPNEIGMYPLFGQEDSSTIKFDASGWVGPPRDTVVIPDSPTPPSSPDEPLEAEIVSDEDESAQSLFPSGT